MNRVLSYIPPISHSMGRMWYLASIASKVSASAMTVPMDMTWLAQLVSVSMTANLPMFSLLDGSTGIISKTGGKGKDRIATLASL